MGSPRRRWLGPLLLTTLALLAGSAGAQASLTGASFGAVHPIPSPLGDALPADGPVSRDSGPASEGSKDPGDEQLDRHGAQPAEDQGMLAGLLGAVPGWALAAGLAPALIGLAAGLAVVRSRSRSTDGTEDARSIPSRSPDERAEEPAAFLEEPPPPGIDGVLEIAQAFIANDAWEDAVRWFETAIALDPQLTVAHFCLGLALEQLGRDEEALEAYRAVDALGGTGPAPVYRQARVLARTGEHGEAMRHLARALQEEPELRDDAEEDPAFGQLADHPRFLALIGRL